MIAASESPNRGVWHWMLFGERELRAGWRLLIFLAIVIALIKASDVSLGVLLHRTDGDTKYLVFTSTHFIMFLLATRIMGRIEGKTIADYGLPWRKMFRVQFMQGRGARSRRGIPFLGHDTCTSSPLRRGC